MKKSYLNTIAVLIAATLSSASANDDLLLLPTDLQYIGAFRLPYVYGQITNFGFSSGRFAVHPETNSMFIAGKTFGTITQLEIPTPIDTLVLSEMNVATQLQPFTALIDRIEYSTPLNNIRSYSGMEFIDGKLVVISHDPYDAASSAGFDVDNFWIVETPFDLENTAVRGYSEMEGNTYLAGWMSPIPVNLQEALGGDYLTGSARMASINGRWSMGPSAGSFNKSDLLSVESGGTVPTTTLQRYPLHNRMWSHLPEPVNNWNYSGGHYFTDPNCPDWKLDFDTPAHYNWKQECVLNNDLWTRAFKCNIWPNNPRYANLPYTWPFGRSQNGAGL